MMAPASDAAIKSRRDRIEREADRRRARFHEPLEFRGPRAPLTKSIRLSVRISAI